MAVSEQRLTPCSHSVRGCGAIKPVASYPRTLFLRTATG